MEKSGVSSIIRQFLLALLNPVSVVALFGPLLISVNLLWLRANLPADHHLMTFTNDPVVLAFLDYRIQLFTAIIAFVFYFFDNIRKYWHFARQADLNLFWDRADIKKQINIVVGVLITVIVLYTMISGAWAKEWIINCYLRPAGSFEIGVVPPLDSPLTWLRVLIIGAGVTSTFAFNDTR